MFKRFLAGAATALVLLAHPALSQDAYPVKVVKLVTHSSPGSGSDIFLRNMSKYLGPIMGVTFVVENISGSGGAKAIAALAQSPADGSIFYATTPTYIFTSLLSSPQYTYKDVEPLVNVFTDQEVIFTRTDGPFQSLEDVIKSAKESRGKWGASTPGSLERQSLERLKKAADVKAAIVTHDGGGDLLIDVLNGTVDIGVGEYGELKPQLDGGKVRVLAVFAADRLKEAPSIPTVKETGYDVVVRKFRGLAGPKGLPDNVIKAWEDGIQKVLADPDYTKQYSGDVLTPDYISHEQYVNFINQFGEDTAAFFKETGVTK